MKVTISFLHLEHTPALDEKIQEKTAKLQKYLGPQVHIKWHCYAKGQRHCSELALTGPNINFHATATSNSLYKTLDLVIEKIEKQIVKRKEKLKNRIHRHEPNLKLIKTDLNAMDNADQYWMDEEDAA